MRVCISDHQASPESSCGAAQGGVVGRGAASPHRRTPRMKLSRSQSRIGAAAASTMAAAGVACGSDGELNGAAPAAGGKCNVVQAAMLIVAAVVRACGWGRGCTEGLLSRRWEAAPDCEG